MKRKILGILVVILLIVTTATAYENMQSPTMNEKCKEIGENNKSQNISNRIPSLINDNNEVEDQKQDDWCNWGFGVYGKKRIAQSFTPTLFILTKVFLLIFGPAHNKEITISIRDGLNGDDLTSVSHIINLTDNNGVWIEFDFPDLDVIPGQEYYIVWKQHINGDFVYWAYGEDNPYDNGKAWVYRDSWDYLIFDHVINPVDFCFITYGINQNPGNPSINGPQSGKAQEFTDYTFNTIDPEGHDVRYYIEWGDGIEFKWIGPYESGEVVTKGHSWASEGNYTIRVKAKDIHSAESDWTELEVSMPKNKAVSSPFIQFLENHPRLFPLLRQILGLK